MDIAIQIIDTAITHDLSYDAAKEARRLRRGDIVEVYLATNIGTWSGTEYIPNETVSSPRCGFIFVTGAPDTGIEKLRQMMYPEGEGSGILYRRRWRAQLASIPAAQIDRYWANGRYITYTWLTVKTYVTRNLNGAFITDADVS